MKRNNSYNTGKPIHHAGIPTLAHLIGEGSQQVNVDDFSLDVGDLWYVYLGLQLHVLFLDADGAMPGPKLCNVAGRTGPGVLLTDSFLDPPVSVSVVHFYHTHLEH